MPSLLMSLFAHKERTAYPSPTRVLAFGDWEWSLVALRSTRVSDAQYLREQAAKAQRLAGTEVDKLTAKRLFALAEEYIARAIEIENSLRSNR